jgi:uncharacterized membrane protein YfhO
MDPDFDPSAAVVVEGALDREHGGPHREMSATRLVLRDGPNCVTIRASINAPGYLVLADTWYPGWRATVDGEPAALMCANHAFRALQLEAGEHEIEMVYRPRSAVVGGATSLTALALFAFGMLVIHRETVQS